jgi:hypothetical protein
MTTPTDALDKARTHVHTAWYRFTDHRNLHAKVPDWRTLPAGDGSSLLSAEVVGPGAAHALARFVATGPIGLPTEGDTRPTVDYSTEGRVSYVWRCHGVWVELWHPDSVRDLPVPVPGPALRSSDRLLSGRWGGLLFTRRSKTPKETTA